MALNRRDARTSLGGGGGARCTRTNARIGAPFQSGFGVSFNSSPEDNTLPRVVVRPLVGDGALSYV